MTNFCITEEYAASWISMGVHYWVAYLPGISIDFNGLEISIASIYTIILQLMASEICWEED